MSTDPRRGRHRARLLILALTTAAVALGCSPSTEAPPVAVASDTTRSRPSNEPRPTASSATSSTEVTATNTSGTTNGSRTTDASSTTDASTATGEICEITDQTSMGPVENLDLMELSGLVGSPTDSETLWAHNDSGSAARLFRVGFDGSDLGDVRLLGDAGKARDIEDIAVNGHQLMVADVGDNMAARDHVTVYLIDEPEPGEDDQGISPTTTIEFTYSTGPTDVEAVFVDPVDGAAYLIAKDRPSSRDGNLRHPLYRLKLDGDPADEALALEVGSIELPLAEQADGRTASWNEILRNIALPLLEVPTGADISADGSVIAVRTYASVWLFQRQATESVIEALSSEPCRVGVPEEAQGEAIALVETTRRSDGSSEVVFVTASEGRDNALTRTTAVMTRAEPATS